MFIVQPELVTDDMLEGTNFRMVNGELRYFTPALGGHSIPATWVKCDKCGKVAPAGKYNEGKYCSTKCAYADRKGERHVNYKGRYVNERGYVRLTLPEGGRVHEHRYVMEQKIGRPLEAWEHVHHINGNPSDNSPENLEIWEVKSVKPKTHPNGVRKIDSIKTEILELPSRQRAQLLKWLQDLRLNQ